MCICKCICIFDVLLIVCGCLCMHKHMRAQQTQMHVFFVMCFLTWGASADACSSRAQEPHPALQPDQRTAVGRVRRSHIAGVSARQRKRSCPPSRLSSSLTFSSRHFWTKWGQACACLYTFACMHACLCLYVCVCVCVCMHACMCVFLCVEMLACGMP